MNGVAGIDSNRHRKNAFTNSSENSSGSRKRKTGLMTRKNRVTKTRVVETTQFSPTPLNGYNNSPPLSPPQQHHVEEIERVPCLCSYCGEPKGFNEVGDSRHDMVLRYRLDGLHVQFIGDRFKSICAQCLFKINKTYEVTESLKKQAVIHQHLPPATNKNGHHSSINGIKRTNKTTHQVKSELRDDTSSSRCSEKVEPSNLYTPETVPEITRTTPTSPATNYSEPTTPEGKNNSENITSSSNKPNGNLTPLSSYSPREQRINEIPLHLPPKPVEEDIRNVSGKYTFVTDAAASSDHEEREEEDIVRRKKCRTSNERANPIRTPTMRNRSLDKGSEGGGVEMNQSMLKVICERSESALVTESGGKINNYQRNKRQRGACSGGPQMPMTCPNCAKVYIKKFYFVKHKSRCRTRKLVKSTTVKVNSVCSSLIVYRCTECNVTVENAQLLNTHKQIHRKRYYCACKLEFFTQYEHDFHYAACRGKEEANEELNSTMAVRRMTRARSLALSRAASIIGDDDNNVENEDDNDLNGINSNEYDEDEDISLVDDGCSVADTMYSLRMVDTSDWLNTVVYWGKKSQEKKEEMFPKSMRANLDAIIKTTLESQRSADIVALDKLKTQIISKHIPCDNCSLHFVNLYEYMVHHYRQHFQIGWFHCKKCRNAFTKKVFLDYHLEYQNYGMYGCFKCCKFFKYQIDLDRHLILHKNDASHQCKKCPLQFTSSKELKDHDDSEYHLENGLNPKIIIDSTMTVANRMPPEQCSYEWNYSERTLEMESINYIPKRSRPLQYNVLHRIGLIEFAKPKSPNCANNSKS